MILDIDQLDQPPQAEPYSVCIAGGGVAGILLAKSLAERGRRVLLLEAGGQDYSDRSQAIYKGESIGRQYFDLDVARLRYLGGSSNHWNGLCRPLEPYDFSRRDHIPDSGWPIGIADLDPYLLQACQILEIDEFPQDRDLAGADDDLKEISFHLSPPVLFKDKYQEFLQSSDAVDVYLNANLVDIAIDTDSGRVSGFAFRSYGDDRPIHTATADQYILALGGIENARVLLRLAAAANSERIGEHDLVGRFFMEHPHHIVGYYVTSEDSPFGRKRRFIAPTYSFMQRDGIANCAFRTEPILELAERNLLNQAKDLVKRGLCASDFVAELARTAYHFSCPAPRQAGWLLAASEQVPNAQSRIILAKGVDEFGLRRVALDWQLSPIDKKTMRAVGIAVGKYFARTEIGRIKLLDWILAEDDTIPGLAQGEELAGFHHMGTTRMGFSNRDGVVDRDCRVFGVPNLYIAGSSVFRTGGHANPTLTIVQLALRLADHLAAT